MAIPNPLSTTNAIAIPTPIDHLVLHIVESHTPSSNKKKDVENPKCNRVYTRNANKCKHVIIELESSAS